MGLERELKRYIERLRAEATAEVGTYMPALGRVVVLNKVIRELGEVVNGDNEENSA